MTEDLGEMKWFEAKKACKNLGEGWRLPTRDELTLLHEQLHWEKIGEFWNVKYWSSEEYDLDWAYYEDFNNYGSGYGSKKELNYVRAVRAEHDMDVKSFTTILNHWGPEHVIIVPIRHCMVADGVVNQMEKNAMAHFLENFGEIGEASSNVWDSTDDEIMQIHSDG